MINHAALENLIRLEIGIGEPLGIIYTDTLPEQGLTPASTQKHACIINYLRLARLQNCPVWFTADTPGCMGGWVYLGFILPPPDRIAHFVTTGLPDKEGEHYLPEPASMHRLFKALDIRPATGKYCVVQPVSMFKCGQEPELIVFHCRAEALTGLCGLSYFALDDHDAIMAPFGSGCSNIFTWPLHYRRQGLHKAVIGGMDPSCRPFMRVDELSFTVTPEILDKMLDAVDSSFLHGKTWSRVRKRIDQSNAAWKTQRRI